MKKNLRIILGILAMSVAVFGLSTGVSAAATGAKIVIRVKGSDDMAGRVDRLSKIFVKDHPNFSVIVSGGSGSAFPDFLDGNCEVLMLGHSLSKDQRNAAAAKGIELTERLVGYGGICILTYPKNPIDELTVDQVKKLMIGDYTWKQVGGTDDPVVVVSVAAMNSDTRMFLMRDFLGVPAVRPKVVRVSYFRTLPSRVAETPGGLGYSRLRDVEGGKGDGAKVLKIKKAADAPAVKPSRESLADGSFPIRRPFLLCFDSRAGQNVKKFVDFIVSKGWPKAN
jgi:phosphate transport system substrate-binding protein